MKKIALLLSALLFASSAGAADTIVYVDFERIYRNSALIGEAQKKLQAEFRGREEALDAVREEIVSLRQLLEKDGITLSDEERSERERQIVKMERDFVRGRQALVEDRTLRFQEQRTVIDSEIHRTILQLAKEENHTIVLNPFLHFPISGRQSLSHNIILYADPKADITDKVAELFDKEANINL